MNKSRRVIMIDSGDARFSLLSEKLKDDGYYIDRLERKDECSEYTCSDYFVIIVEHSTLINGFAYCEKVDPDCFSNIIMISDLSPVNIVKKAYNSGCPDHLVSMDLPDLSSWIQSSLQKLAMADHSGINHHFKLQGSPMEKRISQSKKKDKYLADVIKYYSDFGIRPRILRNVEEIADELITNAIFNAPTDNDQRFLYSSMNRTKEINLLPYQSSLLSYVFEQNKIILSIKDPFGSLTRNKLFYHLSKHEAGNEIVFDKYDGGAGIGLYKTIQLAHNFIVNIHPQKYTEFIICISTDADLFKKEALSIDVFVRSNP